MFLNKKPSQYLQEIKELMKSERINQDFKQAELAKKAGISYSTYTKFVLTNSISLDRLVSLLIALKMTNKLDALIVKNDFTSIEQLKKIDKIKSTTKKELDNE
jgi:transcriptional regulator with XRE-family HTH domain